MAEKYYVTVEVRMVVKAESELMAKALAAGSTARMDSSLIETKGCDVIAATKE